MSNETSHFTRAVRINLRLILTLDGIKELKITFISIHWLIWVKSRVNFSQPSCQELSSLATLPHHNTKTRLNFIFFTRCMKAYLYKIQLSKLGAGLALGTYRWS